MWGSSLRPLIALGSLEVGEAGTGAMRWRGSTGCGCWGVRLFGLSLMSYVFASSMTDGRPLVVMAHSPSHTVDWTHTTPPGTFRRLSLRGGHGEPKRLVRLEGASPLCRIFRAPRASVAVALCYVCTVCLCAKFTRVATLCLAHSRCRVQSHMSTCVMCPC